MNVTLVVASGVHKGKMIPVSVPEFLIGRDPHCQLRPASPAVSKQHFGLFIKNGKVSCKDFGSTNGSFLNDTQLEPNIEHALTSGDRLRVGPLDFTIQIVVPKLSDTTPLPHDLKDLNSASAQGLKAAIGAKPGSSTTLPPPKPAPAAAPAIPIPKAPSTPAGSESEDELAAMLLADDDGNASVPDGSTVFEMPAPTVESQPVKTDDKGGTKKTTPPTVEASSNAANDILRRYMRRPR